MAEQAFALADEVLDRVAGGRYLGPTFVYVVQDKDSLPILAQRFATTVRVLLELNTLPNPKRLEPGTRLLIPQR